LRKIAANFDLERTLGQDSVSQDLEAAREIIAGGPTLANGDRSMATVVFTTNVQRHVLCPQAEAPGTTVREVLDHVFTENAEARGYVLDDQSGLRKHMTVFVDGQMVRDRARLSDRVGETSTIYVFQALSGG
jgi:sulfur-carrier protein